MEPLKSAIKKTGLDRPLRKLLSPSYRRRQKLAERFIAEIRQRGHDALRAKYEKSDYSSSKYLELKQYIPEVVAEAAKLDLLGPPPRRVLDIGCGTGYFLYVLKGFGHDVRGIDIPDAPRLYSDMIDLLGITRLGHTVTKFQPLPAFGQPLDLITAFSIVFDRITDIWGVDEWRFFVDDCRSRLAPRGRIFLNFNPGKISGVPFVSDEVAAMLRSLPGARLSPSKEFFTLGNP